MGNCNCFPAKAETQPVVQSKSPVAAPSNLEYASDPPCFFPTDWTEVPVLQVRADCVDAKIITFGLPDGTSINMPVSCAIMMRKGQTDDNKPYNPINSNADLGKFDLCIRSYPDGNLSKYADSLQPGDRVSFKQIKPNVKQFQYPFGKKSITMVAVGSGITPHFQALWPLLKTPGDETQVRLIYGNKTPDHIMLKSEIDKFAADHKDRFEVMYVVGNSARDGSAMGEGWEGEMGWIDEEKMEKFAFRPGVSTVVWLCGHDAFYKTMAGSRFNPIESGSIVDNLGYTADMLWRS